MTANVWKILNRKQRRAFLWLLTGLSLGALAEMAGIGLLFPVLVLMTDPATALQGDWMSKFQASVGHLHPSVLVTTGMGMFLLVHAFKTVLLVALAWLQSRFIESLIVDLSQRLFAEYLARPSSFHIQQNSSHLMRTTTGEVAVAAAGVQNTLGLLSEALVALGITSVMLLVDPRGVVIMMLLLGVGGLWFHRLTRHRIVLWAEAGQQHERLRLQHLQQGFEGINEIKLMGVESYILQGYARHNTGSASSLQRQAFLSALPRLWLESLVVGAIGVYVIAAVHSGTQASVLVPTMGLLGAAAFRLMPSVNRLLQAIQGIRFSMPALQTITNELEMNSALYVLRPPSETTKKPFQDAIELADVGFNYPGSGNPSLQDITLRIQRGTSVGLVGGSGAGKSTFIGILLGLLPPTQGTVLIDGVPLESQRRAWQDQIGYVPQAVYLSDDTLRRNVAFGVPDEQIDEDAVTRSIHDAQLETLVRELPLGLDTRLGGNGVRLSGGQRQRIGVARALYRDPPVLVLDEGTSALDHATEEQLMAAVVALRGRKTLLIVSHRLSTVAHCDIIHRLDRGRLVHSGPPDQVLVHTTTATPPGKEE